MYWMAVLLMGFFWLCGAIAGWQDGYGLGGAFACLLFFIPLIPLWHVRDRL